jgi:hypothetical protein
MNGMQARVLLEFVAYRYRGESNWFEICNVGHFLTNFGVASSQFEIGLKLRAFQDGFYDCVHMKCVRYENNAYGVRER